MSLLHSGIADEVLRVEGVSFTRGERTILADVDRLFAEASDGPSSAQMGRESPPWYHCWLP